MLSERISIREREIERLAGDRDHDARRRIELEEEIHLLNRSMDQTKGFREMLAMEQVEPDDPHYDEYLQTMQQQPGGSVVEIRAVYMGSVGVDSGQLMITDPCYIDGHWRHEPFDLHTRFADSQSGSILRLGRDFKRFDEPLQPYGLTPHELIEQGRLRELPPMPLPDSFHYSYNGACQATMSDGYGELSFENGPTGAGLVFGSGWGDGIYPVFGEMHNGRILRVYINCGADPVLAPRGDPLVLRGSNIQAAQPPLGGGPSGSIHGPAHSHTPDD